MDKRLTNSWCTGKDSNLRTSLGGTDLQSVGFNHSPTCAKTLGRCGLRFKPADPSCKGRQKALRPDPRTTAAQSHTSRLTRLYSQVFYSQFARLYSQHRETKARARRHREDH